MKAMALVSREWRSSWTDRGAYVLRGAYAGALLLGAAAVWLLLGFGDFQPEQIPGLVRSCFDEFCRFQFGLATLFASLIFARAVCREQERGTLDFLILSPLNGTEILAGKLAGEFLGVAALLASGLPMFLLILPLGGVSVSQILCVQGVILAQMLLVGGVCVAFAALFGRTLPVMVGAGTTIGLCLGGPVLGRMWFPQWNWLWRELERLSLGELLARQLITVDPEPGAVAIALGIAAALSLMFCGLGSLVLERRHVRGSRVGLLAPLAGRIRRFFATPRAGFLSIVLVRLEHPLTRRECSVDRGLWFRILWVGQAVGYIAGLAWALKQGFTRTEPHLEVVAWALGAACVILVLQGTLSIAADRRRGMLETLLASGVSPGDLVWSRMAGFLLRAFLLLFIPVFHLIFIAYVSQEFSHGEMAWRIPLGLAGLAVGAVFMAQTTLWSALRHRRPEVGLLESLIFAVPGGLVLAAILGAHPLSFFVILPLAIAAGAAMHVRLIRKLPLWVLR